MLIVTDITLEVEPLIGNDAQRLIVSGTTLPANPEIRLALAGTLSPPGLVLPAQ